MHFYLDAHGIVTHSGEDDVLICAELNLAGTDRSPPAEAQIGQIPTRLRIRGLVVVLMFVLWGSLPLLDVPIATSGGCVLQTPHTIANNTLEERDYLVRTIAFEAANEPDEGQAAVAHVILNRKRSARWANTIKDVVTQPWQFEPWMTRREEMESLAADDPRYLTAARIADAVLAAQIADPTAGATHFLNSKLVRIRNGGSLPLWAAGDGRSIGRHTFYSPEKAGAQRLMSGLLLPRRQKSC